MTHPLGGLTGWVKRSKIIFSEHGHVAYQIKRNHEMQQYVSKYFARRSTQPWELGRQVLFQSKLMLRFKLKGIAKCSSMVANILPADPPPLKTLNHGVKRSKFKIFRTCQVAYKIKWNNEMQQHGNKYFARRPTSPTPRSTLGMGSNGRNSTFSEHGLVAYQIKGNYELQRHGSTYFPANPPPRPW